MIKYSWILVINDNNEMKVIIYDENGLEIDSMYYEELTENCHG